MESQNNSVKRKYESDDDNSDSPVTNSDDDNSKLFVTESDADNRDSSVTITMSKGGHQYWKITTLSEIRL